MSDWNKKVASTHVDLKMHDLYSLIQQLPDVLIAELLIEVLCQQNPKINEPVYDWLKQYKMEDLLSRIPDES